MFSNPQCCEKSDLFLAVFFSLTNINYMSMTLSWTHTVSPFKEGVFCLVVSWNLQSVLYFSGISTGFYFVAPFQAPSDSGFQSGQEMACDKGVVVDSCVKYCGRIWLHIHSSNSSPAAAEMVIMCLSQHPALHSETVSELMMPVLSNLQQTQ